MFGPCSIVAGRPSPTYNFCISRSRGRAAEIAVTSRRYVVPRAEVSPRMPKPKPAFPSCILVIRLLPYSIESIYSSDSSTAPTRAFWGNVGPSDPFPVSENTLIAYLLPTMVSVQAFESSDVSEQAQDQRDIITQLVISIALGLSAFLGFCVGPIDRPSSYLR